MSASRRALLPIALIFAAGVSSMPAFGADQTADTPSNPLLVPYETPFEVPPFDQIQVEHYLPAFKEAMQRQLAEIEAIAGSPEPPTFENTFDRLDKSGILLGDLSAVFFGLHEAHTNEQMQAVAQEVAPLLAAHRDSIVQNDRLFARIQAVYQARQGLNPEQQYLLGERYKSFVRSGASLNETQKARLRELNRDLSVLAVQFSDNLLAETNDFQLVIEDEADLAGLPPSVVASGRDDAAQAGMQGKWIYTLHKPSMIPFLQYSERRPLREKLYTAYSMRGDRGNQADNKAVVQKIAQLSVERAQLLGYQSPADLILESNMARRPPAVYEFLRKLWDAALPMAKAEAAELQQMVRNEGGEFALDPWDWWFYAEKVKKAKYAFDDSVMRPYFKLDGVRDGIFTLSERLWGLRFVARDDLPRYHPDVQVFEVQEADGRHLGLLYMDFFPRPSKRVGAWSGTFRSQYRIDGENVTPIATVVCNFSKPTSDEPSLLSLDEVKTFFHEFGHALNWLFSDCDYRYRAEMLDAVELPSQIMENWALEPEMLALYAKHYRTGEVIPLELVEKLKKSQLFNQGFETVEYLAASFLDMDWYTIAEPKPFDVNEFERESMRRVGLIKEIWPRYRTPYFVHIWSDGYAAGYYSYIWAEVLDADAFQAFKEKGLFDRETALSFRRNVLAKTGTDDAMALFKKFRGAEPKIDALLKRRGLVLPAAAPGAPSTD